MADTKKAVVKKGHRVHHIVDKKEVVSVMADGIIELSETEYAEAKAVGAIRDPKPEDKVKTPAGVSAFAGGASVELAASQASAAAVVEPETESKPARRGL